MSPKLIEIGKTYRNRGAGRRFPIIRTRYSEGAPQPDWIPWELLALHEAQAIRNHDQTLEQLAQRGGLDVCEAVAILDDMRFLDRWGIGRSNGRDQTREAIAILETLCKPYNKPYRANKLEHPSGLSGEHSVVLDAIHQECLHGR